MDFIKASQKSSRRAKLAVNLLIKNVTNANGRTCMVFKPITTDGKRLSKSFFRINYLPVLLCKQTSLDWLVT